MLSPEFICVPDLDTYLTQGTGVSRGKHKVIVYAFACLAIGNSDTWQFSRVNYFTSTRPRRT
jgi:hypothetical protein